MSDSKLEILKSQVRERPLIDRLHDSRHMIAQMCAKGRPPAMSIPASSRDEDLFIITTLLDAVDALTGQSQGQYVALTMLPDHALVVLCDPSVSPDIELFRENCLAAWQDGGQHRLLRFLRPADTDDGQAQFICRTETAEQACAIAKALNRPAEAEAAL